MDDMLFPAVEIGRLDQVAAEDRRKGVLVRKVEIAERRDGDVELDRVDAAAEDAGARAALQDFR